MLFGGIEYVLVNRVVIITRDKSVGYPGCVTYKKQLRVARPLGRVMLHCLKAMPHDYCRGSGHPSFL